MVTEAIKREILRLDSEGQSPKQIRLALGLTKGTVAGELYRHRHVTKPYDNVTNHAPRDDTPSNIIKLFSVLPKPKEVTRPENENTDEAEWIQRRDLLLANHRFVRVMHMNDLHLPYYHEDALNLWFEIARRFKPQIVVVGSDMLDLPTISRFAPDPDIQVGDWHFEARQFYWPIILRLKRLLPKAILVWVYGNHEWRALNTIKSDSSPVLGLASWIQTIQCGGRVLHIGRTENVEIGGLVVAHGNKANKYAAASMGMQWPDKVVNFGHIHRHQVIGNGFSNGMLCQLKPHYDDKGYPVTQEHGTSIMTVDTHTGRVLWSHSKFEQVEGGLIAQYGDGLISVKRQEMAESEAA